jgi:fumarate reductase subunit D
VGALFLPALVFGLTLALPQGWLGDPATDSERLHSIVSSFAARLILFALVSLVFWHAAHHARYLMVALGLKSIEAPICFVAYGLALLGTLVALATLFGG